jgi:hypothetical protein
MDKRILATANACFLGSHFGVGSQARNFRFFTNLVICLVKLLNAVKNGAGKVSLGSPCKITLGFANRINDLGKSKPISKSLSCYDCARTAWLKLGFPQSIKLLCHPGENAGYENLPWVAASVYYYSGFRKGLPEPCL